MPGLGIGNGIPFKNLNMFPYYYGAIRPCLENLSFWQGLNLYDSNTVDNKVEGGSDISIQNTAVVYFDGTVNGIGTITDDNVKFINYVELYFSYDNIIWSKWSTGDESVLGLFEVVGDTLTIGKNANNYFTGYISHPSFYRKTFEKITPILKFTFAENNIQENVNYAYDYTGEFQFPNNIVLKDIVIEKTLII